MEALTLARWHGRFGAALHFLPRQVQSNDIRIRADSP